MKVLFLDKTHRFLSEILTQQGHECLLHFDSAIEDILPQLAVADGLVVRSRVKITSEIMDLAPKLKFIARVGAGMEGIDADHAAKRNITCLNAPEGNRDAVAEHACGMILCLLNNIIKANHQVRNKIWLREENRGTELMGKTLAIIGYGNTGGAFAKRMKAFGMNVLAYDKYKKDFSDEYVVEATMNQVFSEADFLSLNVPLTDETTYLVNASFIESFSKKIFIINTSRGKVVDTGALVDGLDSGKIQGAALDVLEYESDSFARMHDSPVLQKLLSFENVVFTPHVAGWTFESEKKLATVLAEKIIAHVRSGSL
ncbi:MAG: hypothetical protein KKA07_00535 [Bacteroidetes bacterium]|nr:hypothetical protein [Bacteroidota bacterium]MBU1717537.1 hypothetical protein [Bacteroidota bacterium]